MKIFLLPILTCSLFVVSCGGIPPSTDGGSAAYTSFDLPASRPSNPNNVQVKVSLQNQAAYVMEGSRPLLVMPLSVGKPQNPTPTGNFRIYNKEAKRRANTHGFAYQGNAIFATYRNKKPDGWNFIGTPMPYWCEFTPAYGFHTGWMKHSPCTHGCLRMHENLAPKFFHLVREGTPVSIRHSQPEDGTIGRNIPRPPDAGPLKDYPRSFYLGDGYYTKHKTPTFQ